MAFAYKFDCYNEVDNLKIAKYDRQYDHVRVYVTADDETEARALASGLVEREQYELKSISELAPDGHVIAD